jgi:hypothetical protein
MRGIGATLLFHIQSITERATRATQKALAAHDRSLPDSSSEASMGRELMVADSTALGFPGGAPRGKRKKGKKGKRGNANDVLHEDVGSALWESVGMVGIQKFYVKGKMDSIDADDAVKDKGKAKQELCFKGILLGIVAERMLAPGTALRSGAKALRAVAAVNLGNTL